MARRPNVILITGDQLRGDSLGCYGHPIVETPHLDQLANEGVRYTRAYTACPSCIPARAGILTGMSRSHWHGDPRLGRRVESPPVAAGRRGRVAAVYSRETCQ